MAPPEIEVSTLTAALADRDPSEVLARALEQFDHIALSFSGAEDVVLVDMAARLRDGIQVFSLDTGRLHPETYRFLEEVRTHYKDRIVLEILSPDSEQLRDLVTRKGLFSFLRDGHAECCGIRKVMPLKRKLSTLDAWITGQRKDQSPGTRAGVAVVEKDSAFSGRNGTLLKFNPLANWSSAQVWEYLRSHELPRNELHTKGYISIGCEPCTRAVLPNQHEREGRWWWESEAGKECGLHTGNLRNPR